LFTTKLVNGVLCSRVRGLFAPDSSLYKITGFGEEEEKSSHYGLDMLGFTRTTKAKTEGCNGEI